MKKLITILAAGLGLLACTKEAPVAETATQPLKFNLTVTRADTPNTKAVKTGWEDGDVVFVFFSEATAPKYLEMKYDAETESWTSTQKNGTTEEAFDVPGGWMIAVHLPFGNDAEVVEKEGNFAFNKMYYCYYLASESVRVVIENGVVTGELNMQLPDGFVQFFAEAPAATAERASRTYLWESHVAPAGIESVSYACEVNMAVRPYGTAMPAYYYDNGVDPKGFHFSGILDEEARGVATAYTFHINLLGNIYATVSGTKTLYTETSRALKLPADDSEAWVTEEHPWVDLGMDVKWATMNVGATSSSSAGNLYAWGETIAKTTSSWDNYSFTSDGGSTFTKYTGSDYSVLLPADDAATANWGAPWRMPTKEEWEELMDEDKFTWEGDVIERNTSHVEYYDVNGYKVTSKIPGYEGRSIYLPVNNAYVGGPSVTPFNRHEGLYWSSAVYPTDVSQAYMLRIGYDWDGGEQHMTNYRRYTLGGIRPVCE